MTTTKLLSGVALAALLSGAALAQDNFTAATGDLRTDRDFASEYDGDIGAEAIFTHDSDHADYDALGATAVVDITITATGGLVLGEIADDADFGDAGAPACTMTVQSGGGIGSTSVTYRSTGTFRDCAGDNTFSLQMNRLAANAGQDSGATVAVTCNSDCGTFVSESDSFTLIDETSAFPPASRVVTAGGTVTIDVDGIGPVGPHALGNVSYEFNNVGGTIFTDGNGTTPAGVAAIVVGDAVASGSLVIDFPGGDDGIATVTVDAAGAACAEDAGAAVTTWTCPLTSAQVAALAPGGNVAFTSDNVAAIAQQTPTAALTVTSNAGYSAPAGPSGPLAPVEWNDGLGETPVASGGATDWVRFGTGGTESNFRIQMATAAGAAAVTQVQVTVGEEGNGIPAATYNLLPGTVDTGFVANGATVTFNSRALGAVAGVTGNANITGINLQALDANAGLMAGADVDRQLVNRSPSSYVATGGLSGN